HLGGGGGGGPVYRRLGGRRIPAGGDGKAVRRFLEGGLSGQRATLDDWRLHLTTLFPEVRLKGYIELRSADSQTPDRVLAVPALVKGIFYEQDCLDAAFDLVKRWTFADCVALYGEVTRQAMGARMKGIQVLELTRELASIAEEGLKRQGALDSEGRDERVYLERLREGLRAGKSPANLLADRWSGQWHQEARQLVAATAFP